MAPVGDQMDRENGYGDNTDDKKEGNLWASILSEVQQSSSTKLPACKNLLVLGDNESGKTTLMAKLQGNEDPRKGSGLEYTFIDVKDEYRDDHTRLGVWIVDGELHHRGLLKYALSPAGLPHTLVLLVVSMAQPWSVLESLRRWAEVLSTHLDRLKLPAATRRDYEEALVQQFQEYVEPEEGVTPRRPGKPDEDKVLLPLGETTLTHNLGVPIVVVVTKSDAISTLEKEHDYREEHFDFIQQHIRKFCLNYGTGLLYTSVKEDKNCDLLYKYLVHRIYKLPFNHPASVVERDSVFVPFGWDTERKISILYESMTSVKPDDTYEDVIVKPITRKPIQRDAEVTAEDEQVFLMKQQTQISKTPTPGPRDSPMRPSPGVQKPTTSPRVGASPNVPSPVKKLDAGKPGATSNEGVLANFFNSLLSKKTGGAPGQGPPGNPAAAPGAKTAERAAMSRDAAAELERINRTKKAPPPQANSTS